MTGKFSLWLTVDIDTAIRATTNYLLSLLNVTIKTVQSFRVLSSLITYVVSSKIEQNSIASDTTYFGNVNARIFPRWLNDVGGIPRLGHSWKPHST